MTYEEKLKYAKKNYPVGTTFMPAWNDSMDKQISFTVTGNYNTLKKDVWCDIKEGGCHCLYDDDKKKWAKIISKPEEEIKMTHEKAIELLEKYLSVFNDKEPMSKAMKYCLNQIKQCEVFDEPKKMLVSSDEFFDIAHKRKIKGRFLNSYIGSDFGIWLFARPIKKEPLSFSEYCNNQGVTVQDFGDIKLDEMYYKYQEYLKEFND